MQRKYLEDRIEINKYTNPERHSGVMFSQQDHRTVQRNSLNRECPVGTCPVWPIPSLTVHELGLI